MASDRQLALLKKIPPMTELLASDVVVEWLKFHPLPLVTDCLRRATAGVRARLLSVEPATEDSFDAKTILDSAGRLLAEAVSPRLRVGINATGVILHTGLGRAVLPSGVVDSMLPELKGYCTLAVDRESGERIERDELVEPILVELTGAEAATVVNNNAAATLLVLASLAAHKEVIVSRGQLIEIGGSFRLPEVMAQSQARLVEVGATNRTHLKDYQKAIGPETAALMRVHPSNYRIIGFTSEPALSELAALAREKGVLLVDDLGAGALLDLEQFGLPHEPTVRESIEAGSDVVLFSGDKLIGAGQCGIIVGRKSLIERVRRHPLMRALRVDKTCLMLLERTLHLFRSPELLRKDHPTYRMICTPSALLKERAEKLRNQIADTAPGLQCKVEQSLAYVGSGSLPTETLPSWMVTISSRQFTASSLAKALRMDEGCVFARIESDKLRLDVRTITDAEVPLIAEAFARIVASGAGGRSQSSGA